MSATLIFRHHILSDFVSVCVGQLYSQQDKTLLHICLMMDGEVFEVFSGTLPLFCLCVNPMIPFSKYFQTFDYCKF